MIIFETVLNGNSAHNREFISNKSYFVNKFN